MSIHRSFLVPANAKEAKFQAPVAQFLGVIPGPNCFIILTVCDQVAPTATTGLLGPTGAPAPKALVENSADPTFIVTVCREFDEAPRPHDCLRTDADGLEVHSPIHYLGSVLTHMGPAALYVRRA